MALKAGPKPAIAEKDVEEQLILLRDLTARLGVLHDAQVFQLRMWPLVLFTHAKQVDLHIQMEDKEISFVIEKHKGKVPEDIKERYTALNDWTKWLLGDDWTVKVKYKGKQVYRAGKIVRAE